MIIGLIGGGLDGLPSGMRYPTLAQGKDTVADYLALKGFTRVAFADSLKQEVAKAYGTTVARLEQRELKETQQDYLALQHCQDQEFVEVALMHLGAVGAGGTLLVAANELQVAMAAPRSPRWVTQLWGTEYRRKRYGDDYWTRQGCEKVSGPGDFLVTDVRMPNEPVALAEMGATLVRIVRPGTEVAYTGGEHVSEIALLHTKVDATLINHEGDFAGLYRQVDQLLERARTAA
ncbi:hypothetical protein [Burkholderia ambifaria]|uniref:hypothetical protein n=1 Tax=Burkholderia ambifaria TaxID=152480 RepID=UPI000F806BB3|nr:hypothetical protein [Burkholderia ambifaria]